MIPSNCSTRIDDAIVHDDVVERAVLEGEARHDPVRIDPERLVARRIDVVREVLGRRDEAGQDRLGGGNGLGWQQPVHQAPAVLFPLRLVGVAEHIHQALTIPRRRIFRVHTVTVTSALSLPFPIGSEACHTAAEPRTARGARAVS